MRRRRRQEVRGSHISPPLVLFEVGSGVEGFQSGVGVPPTSREASRLARFLGECANGTPHLKSTQASALTKGEVSLALTGKGTGVEFVIEKE